MGSSGSTLRLLLSAGSNAAAEFLLGSRYPITAPPIITAPPDFPIFPYSKGEKERRKPYWQLVWEYDFLLSYSFRAREDGELWGAR